MLKALFQLVAVAAGCVCGYLVWRPLSDFFAPSVTCTAGALVAVIVFATLYFLLGKPLAEFIHHRLEIVGSRLRDNRSGTDIDVVPVAHYGKKHELVKCTICGRPGEPVCADCKARLAGD